MRMTAKGKVPEVDVAQAKRILKAAKAYPETKAKMEALIGGALKSKDLGAKDEALRMLRMML